MKLHHLFLVCAALLLSSISHAATGILELDSKPGGAEVFVDGKKKGTTPETEGQKLTMELAEGDHEIVIKKEGTGSATKKVFIGEGVIQPLTLTILAEAYTNPLGMKFVPVPGTQILMCVHETRNKDYAAFAAESSGVDGSWKNPSFTERREVAVNLSSGAKRYGKITTKGFNIKNDDTHPVVKVNWIDATKFCTWLGSKDSRTYRLPTDHEWSCAVGIGKDENAHTVPAEKYGKVAGYPWESAFPPPQKAGNYRDITLIQFMELHGQSWGQEDGMKNYNDGFSFTSPVMSYPPNKIGLYDLGGNVWEWCADLYKPSFAKRVLRGGSWVDGSMESLSSSCRGFGDPDERDLNYGCDRGFRCVMVVTGSSSP